MRALLLALSISACCPACAIFDGLNGSGPATDAGPPADAATPSQFGARVDLDVPGATALAMGDVDGDGIDDLVVSSVGPHVYWIKNGVRSELAVPPEVLDTIAVTDLDGDGHLDLVGTGSGFLVVMPDLRHLGAPSELEVSSLPGRFDLADLNQDGRADVVLSTATQIEVIFAAPTGAPRYDGAPVVVPLPSNAHPLRVIDADNDGDEDILAWQSSSGLLVSDQVPGASPFPTFQTFFNLNVPATLADVVITDLDHDGRRDVLLVVGDAIYLLGNDGAAPFAMAGYTIGTGPFSDLAAGDVDGDGLDEISLGESGGVRVYRQPMARRLDIHGFERLPSPGVGAPFALVMGDLDGDRGADLAFISKGSGVNQRTVSIYPSK